MCTQRPLCPLDAEGAEMDVGSQGGGTASQPSPTCDGGSVTPVPPAPGSGLPSEPGGKRPADQAFLRQKIRMLRKGKGASGWEPGTARSRLCLEANHESPIQAVRHPGGRAGALGSRQNSVPGSAGSSLLRKLLCFKAASPGQKGWEVPPCQGPGEGTRHRPLATLSRSVEPFGESPLRWRQRADAPSPGGTGSRPWGSWAARPWRALRGLIAARAKRGAGPGGVQMPATEAAQGAERDGGDAGTQGDPGERVVPTSDAPIPEAGGCSAASVGTEVERNAGARGETGGWGVLHGGLGAQGGEGPGPLPAPSQGEEGQRESAAGNPGWRSPEGVGDGGASPARQGVGGRPAACVNGNTPEQQLEQGARTLAPGTLASAGSSTDAAKPPVTPTQGELSGHRGRPPAPAWAESSSSREGSSAPHPPPAGHPGHDTLTPLGARNRDAPCALQADPLEQPAAGHASPAPTSSARCHGAQDRPAPPTSLALAPTQAGAMDRAEAAGGSGMAHAAGKGGVCQPSEGACLCSPGARAQRASPGGSAGDPEEQDKRMLYAAAAEIVAAAIDAAGRQVARKHRATGWAGSEGSPADTEGLQCS
ncbi:proto-oncogene vav [Platysternon megacephalum]|uniref:Proto-oncogene vav n=1 Tax=Platysternon megacephalum TaxID=55544 RepID=A0A4D9DVM2_9SAUR|nr:proto-oncogene vav [Platysternon megacephalum]